MLFKKNRKGNVGEAFLYAQFANAFFRDGISPWALYQLPGEREVQEFSKGGYSYPTVLKNSVFSIFSERFPYKNQGFLALWKCRIRIPPLLGTRIF